MLIVGYELGLKSKKLFAFLVSIVLKNIYEPNLLYFSENAHVMYNKSRK